MESLAKIAKYTESDEDTPNEESVVEEKTDEKFAALQSEWEDFEKMISGSADDDKPVDATQLAAEHMSPKSEGNALSPTRPAPNGVPEPSGSPPAVPASATVSSTGDKSQPYNPYAYLAYLNDKGATMNSESELEAFLDKAVESAANEAAKHAPELDDGEGDASGSETDGSGSGTMTDSDGSESEPEKEGEKDASVEPAPVSPQPQEKSAPVSTATVVTPAEPETKSGSSRDHKRRDDRRRHRRSRSRSKRSRQRRSRSPRRSPSSRSSHKRRRSSSRSRHSSRRHRKSSGSHHRSHRSHRSRSPRRHRSRSKNRHEGRGRSHSGRSGRKTSSANAERLGQRRGPRGPNNESLLSRRAPTQQEDFKTRMKRELQQAAKDALAGKTTATPQQALLQTMAAMHAKAQEITGVEVPKFYNPAAVNPLKYAEQMQKRKLLWSKAAENKDHTLQQFQGTDVVADEKYRKLMGIKGEVQVTGNEEAKTKQSELFARLEQEYNMGRLATHTHKGVGLGVISSMAAQSASEHFNKP